MSQDHIAALRRLEQKVREATGKAGAQTRYSAEFENDCGVMDTMRTGMGELTERMAAQLRAQGEDTTVMNKWEAIGDCAHKLRVQIPAGYAGYPPCLDATSEAGRKLGALQRLLQRQAQEQVLSPLRQWLQSHGAEFHVAKETLEKRRLDMDAADNKLILGQIMPRDHETQRAIQHKRAHEEQLNAMKKLLTQLPAHERTQIAALQHWVKLQHDFAKAAADSLQILLR